MKRLLTLILVLSSALAFSQGFSHTQIRQAINAELRLKTNFSSTRTASLLDSLNASTPKLLGSYADPSWITSLAKSKVGLGNVDNTSDANKPVSTAQQTALNLKQNLDADLTAIAAGGTSLQGIRVPSGGGTLEYYSPTTDPGTTIGDLLQLSSISPNVYTRIPDLATGNTLLSGGVGGLWTTGKIGLTTHVSGTLPVANGGTGTTTGLPINNLIAATGSNTINHATNLQTWQWNTLAGATGFQFETSSTAAASNLQKLVRIIVSGANSNSNQATYGLEISNTHTGTGAENVGLLVSASGGSNNYAIAVAAGRVGIGTTSPARDLTINSTAAPILGFSRSGTENALVAASNTSGAFITGDVAGDFVIRTTGGRVLISTNSGTTLHTSIAAGSISTTGSLVGASFRMAISTKTTTYTAAIATDHTLLGDATSGAFDIDLPTAASAVGYKFVIKKIDATGNAVNIDPNGSELIDGTSTSLAITTQWATRTIQSNGTSWFVIGN